MVATNGIYKLAVLGTVAGQQHIHTMHFRSTLEPAALLQSEAAYQQALIDDWQGNLRTAYRAMFWSSDNPCQSYQVRKVCGSAPLPAGVDEAEAGGSTAGTITPSGGDQALAPWLACVTTIRTGLAGRKYRGRNYIGGNSEANVNGATIASAYTDLLNTYFGALKTRYVDRDDLTTPYRWFVFSRLLAGMAGVACQDAGAAVTGFQVRNQLATMKSRKAGSGI